MLFFKRILKEPEGGRAVARKERRGAQRLALALEFPLKAVLGFDRRGGTIAPMAMPGGGEWPGRLLDCSEVGARIRLAPAQPASGAKKSSTARTDKAPVVSATSAPVSTKK